MKTWKAGEEAYSMAEGMWVTLKEGKVSDAYPLESVAYSYTVEGKQHYRDATPALLPFNPFDLDDPKNPEEYRNLGKSAWPFMLNGRPLHIGDTVYSRYYRRNVTIDRLVLHDEKDVMVHFKKIDGAYHDLSSICWPDEVKKAVKARWAYLIFMEWRPSVGFSVPMTKEEAERQYGSTITMVPGTEVTE